MEFAMYTQFDTLNGQDRHQQRNDMLIEVDFKWLMAGCGCWIDPDRLKTDTAYSEQCLAFAARSACEPLRVCADCLRSELAGIDTPAPYGA
jgi:hypothetical protein